MPVNSFENYYMSWKPNRDELDYPLQISLANYLEKDIINGSLCENAKLPPQRELADFLDLSLSTITKAYKICEMKGLIYGIVGKGTFVSPNVNSPKTVLEKNSDLSSIEMGVTLAFPEHNKIIAKIANKILSQPSDYKYFEFSPSLGTEKQKRIAKFWLSKFGINTNERNIAITAGAQNALAISLIALFKPGDKIVTDAYTYANFIGLANMLNIRLIAVKSDANGMNTESLENLCKANSIKGIYLMPSCSNPTNITMDINKRVCIAEIIRKYNLILIEDEIYAFILKDTIMPISSMVPQQSIYISSISKSIGVGLRIAYVNFPERFREKFEDGIYNLNLTISSLNVEIITEIINSGIYEEIIWDKLKLSIERNEIFNEYFPEISIPQNRSTYYQWIPLPSGCTGKLFELKAKEKGVKVYGSERFSVGDNEQKYAIRVATCSPKDLDELRKGLSIIRSIYDEINT